MNGKMDADVLIESSHRFFPLRHLHEQETKGEEDEIKK